MLFFSPFLHLEFAPQSTRRYPNSSHPAQVPLGPALGGRIYLRDNFTATPGASRSPVPKLTHPGAEFGPKTAGEYGFDRPSGSGGHELVYGMSDTGITARGVPELLRVPGAHAAHFLLYQKSTLKS